MRIINKKSIKINNNKKKPKYTYPERSFDATT